MTVTYLEATNETGFQSESRELSEAEISPVSGGSWGAAFFCGALGFIEGGPAGAVAGLIIGAVAD